MAKTVPATALMRGHQANHQPGGPENPLNKEVNRIPINIEVAKAMINHGMT